MRTVAVRRGGDDRVTADSDPQHRKSSERIGDAPVTRTTVEQPLLDHDAEGDPRLDKEFLQAPRERRLARVRTSVQDDHVDHGRHRSQDPRPAVPGDDP